MSEQSLSYIYKVTIGAQVDKINFYFFSTKVLGSLKPSFKKVSSVPLLTDKSKFSGIDCDLWKKALRNAERLMILIALTAHPSEA